MGAWGIGPFDNDNAADWSGDLHEAAPGERAALIRRTLEEVLHEGEYLQVDTGDEAVAAAAVIASLLPGGTALTTAYAPDFLIEGGTLDLPDDLPALALRALDRVAGDDSEWAELWEDGLPKVLAALQPIREVLEAAAAA
ncbi:hypothetical protein FHR83_004472 [Actinoplanes campanulatus]|uniref:DUF4259 domain-containing protein n=1 Tax=Actinoplanes campanulatus TaxID=113559 RepID=A0A7W5AIB6_9ACTN|nr:DUF4259 domain-containing protein [Actinoplanes campanulatus]MBB3096798.1 hypothetical protein [Actinoplanes campanulatus]GGN31409.1 hypothetical protein GCM10010109_51590 [Actinoplanes campanulatus]GID37344.1 hypothetical protein Aca09nite_38500 [Actinoplanes campanulatus]